MELNEQQRAMVVALQDGLPLTSRPYKAIGERLGISEDTAIAGIHELLCIGVIKRWGIVVRHHELGFRHNAMVVWDVPDSNVDQIGNWLGKQTGVTLCYRRTRRPPRWPYNLFCMLHGKEQDTVREAIWKLRQAPALANIPYAVLFSTRRFKQRGAHYRFEQTPHPSKGDDDA